MRVKMFSTIMLAMFLGACMPQYQTSYPTLETGIYLTELQMNLQQQYNEMYPFVTESEQAQMQREIAPLINNMKYRVHLYNQAVQAGRVPPHTEEELVRLAREISFRFLEVKQ